MQVVNRLTYEIMKKTLSPIQDEGNGASSSSDGAGIGIDPKSSVQTVKENLNNLFELQRVHKERLQRVDEEITKLQKFRKDYELLLKRLRTLPDKTSYEVMVPFGSLAFMPGRLLHTNEILVLLGDNWFAERSAKQAAEIVQRRLKDCDEKIKRAEAVRKIHNSWLKEAEEVMTEEAGDQVEILEELTEEEFQMSKEEHRKKVARHYGQLREQKQQTSDDGEAEPPPGTSTASEDGSISVSHDQFFENFTEKDRRTYEDILKRLDQLELEEAQNTTESEDDGESDEDADKVEEVLEEDVEGEVKRNAQTGAELRTKSSEGVMEEESSHKKLLSKRAKLKRRVSWADDLRPLVTVIPDDDSDDIYRIKYSSGPLSLPLEGAEGLTYEEGKSIMDISDVSVETVQSPSDIYKVFGHGASGPDPQPRGILKKSSSLPAQDDGSAVQDGWCYPPQPLDIEVESPEELPPPPPSPPPKRTQSLKPAFSYRVLERKLGEAQAHDSSSSTKTDTEPKKVSKFKAARSKK